jgi:hypothetical protein
MDLNAYINSGIIETYVLGNASEQEVTELFELAANHIEIKHEIEICQSALEKYVLLYKQNPSLACDDKIFKQILNTEKTKNMMYNTKKVSILKTWWMAAALVFVIFSSAINVYLLIQWNMAKNDIAHLHDVNHKLIYQNYISKANYRSASEQLSLLHKHGNKTTHLESLLPNKDFSAMAYWNSETKDVYLSIDYLPQPEQGKQYQMWALVNGKMISAGIIDPEKNLKTLMKMKKIDKATAFAISLEKMGGTKNPTTKAVYVLGTI